jgi:septum formation protein
LSSNTVLRVYCRALFRDASGMQSKQKIILASSSPYRRELLARLGLEFSTISPDIDESALPDETPRALAHRLAVAKAEAVAADLENALVIGSDQVADHDGVVVGKPISHKHAVEQLKSASGRLIVLYTGLALLNTVSGRVQSTVEPFEVAFRNLDSDTIERYLAYEKPYDCCGSLRAEGAGISLLKSLRGDDPNALIGLPLIKLCEMLGNEGVILF